MDISDVITLAKSKRASDIHFVAANPPLFRIDGLLTAMTELATLTADDLSSIFCQLTSDEKQKDFYNGLELDFGCSFKNIGRIRCNVAMQQGTISIVIRLLPLSIPSLDELGLPEICRKLIQKRRGLIVVSGPTGSGKSTTLAAMIDYINKSENRRLVTIEDPIEYIHKGERCTITQRELGRDTHSFAQALKHVLRQDPDVILVGEMRDLETASAALTVAETGHLVLTTGHAPSASQTIERIVDLFPPHERHMAQSQVASLLIGILCQVLVPHADGHGRVPAIEIMLANPAVKNLVREGKLFQLPNTIRLNTADGMQLLDQALVNLYQTGKIRSEDLFSFCNDRDEVEKLVGSGEMNYFNDPNSTFISRNVS